MERRFKVSFIIFLTEHVDSDYIRLRISMVLCQPCFLVKYSVGCFAAYRILGAVYFRKNLSDRTALSSRKINGRFYVI